MGEVMGVPFVFFSGLIPYLEARTTQPELPNFFQRQGAQGVDGELTAAVAGWSKITRYPHRPDKFRFTTSIKLSATFHTTSFVQYLRMFLYFLLLLFLLYIFE